MRIHTAPPEQVRIAVALVAVAFSLYTLLIIVPGTLLFTNLNEFSLRVSDVLGIFIPAFVFSLVVGLAFVMAFKRTLRGRIVAVVLAIGILLWAQSSLLVWRYGALDGTDIDWSSHWMNG